MRGAPERGEKVRGAELFERFAGRVDDERGVTLGELLISILVIAILAAVSQGVYLHQRRKGWSSQVISATKNLASLQEYWVNTEGRIGYTTDLNFLVESGYTYSSDDVVPVIAAAGTGSFCLEVASAHDPSIVWHYDSADGRPAEGPVDPACVAGITVASTDSGTGGALDTPAGSAGDESDPVGGGDTTSSADDGDVGDEGDESGDSAGGDANDTSGNGASGGNDGNDDSGNGSGGSAGSGSGGDQNGGDGNGGGGNGGGGNGGGGNGGGGNGGGGNGGGSGECKNNKDDGKSDPDGDENGGADQPGGTGGEDQSDQDCNNGSGNDADGEDDNNGGGQDQGDEEVST